jgi:hypothetical protein
MVFAGKLSMYRGSNKKRKKKSEEILEGELSIQKEK